LQTHGAYYEGLISVANTNGSISVKLVKKLQRIRDMILRGRAMEEHFNSLLFHRQNQLSASPDSSLRNPSGLEKDIYLIRRIIGAYQRANMTDLGDSMWSLFFASYHQTIHETLISGDEEKTADIFRNPGTSDLFYGFDILAKSYHQEVFKAKSVRNAYAKLCLDGLVRFAESIGAIPIDNPETWPANTGSLWKTENVLTELNKIYGLFSVPNPFPNEHGLKTSRGIISFRVPQALYQAWRIKQLVDGISAPRVLEIGAGLGRTAHYAHELGIKDYTIVDIPISAAAQAYFLGRTIGEDEIHLEGEHPNESSNKVKIITPQTFLDENKTYDLILNVDSLTEMDFPIAQAYWEKIKVSTSKFLSINHEANAFRVRDVIKDDFNKINIQRKLYWMRRGYVEELIQI
jgi:hypothetical protein